jgi:hypothetical protein
MRFHLRYFFASTLFHQFEGITFDRWLGLLRRERFRVSVVCIPRALWITLLSLVNSILAREADRQFGASIMRTRVEAPMFILGHYRSGTTFLHELLAADPRYASPNRFETFNPLTFLLAEPRLAPLIEPLMLPRRVQEDEVASMILTQYSPYMDWCFPKSVSGYGRYLSFREAEPEEIAAWSDALRRFLQAVSLKTGRPLILKSPPHTARVRLLLDIFPDARFVHIRRDPYTVFVSTLGLLRVVRPIFRLQRDDGPVAIDAVLRTYNEMYDAYFADRERIPAGQLIEIAYEDLERDAIGQLRLIYEELSLGDFESIRPAMESYIASVAGYKKNRHPLLDDATRKRVGIAWSRNFEVWGYPHSGDKVLATEDIIAKNW